MAQTHPKLRAVHSWRIFRVLYCLIRRPQDLCDYFRHGLISSRSPLELGMPWWTFGAVREIEGRVHKAMEVFEYGSGGSTVFLAQRCRMVTAVEDDPQWTEAVRKEGARRGLTNIQILKCPYDFVQAHQFEDSDYFRSIRGKKYDLVVVDGQEYGIQVRGSCFWEAERHIRAGGMILVDDSYRYPQIKKRNQAVRFEIFRGTGYCRRGVSETAIFFY